MWVENNLKDNSEYFFVTFKNLICSCRLRVSTFDFTVMFEWVEPFKFWNENNLSKL